MSFPTLFQTPSQRPLWWALLLMMFIALSGCNMPAPAENALMLTQTEIAAQSTLAAQSIQTSAAWTQQALNATASALSGYSTQSAVAATQSVQITQMALHVQQTLVAQAQAETPVPPAPSASPASTFTPLPTVNPQARLEEQIRSANILLYETAVDAHLPRYVKTALDEGGYTYADAGDASGRFKAQLFSGTRWDLVIAAMESRQAAQGEFYRYLNDQLDQGASVIIETWNLDDIAGGNAGLILERCGLLVQSDWQPATANARVLWWLAPNDPVFHNPNEDVSLNSPNAYWTGDAGDLLMLAPDSTAQLLAGLAPTDRAQYGTLASCMNGQLLLQTFSSHDYRREDIVALWQNYIYNTLRRHFQGQP